MATNDLFRIDFDSVPEDMEQSVYEAIQARWPDWEPSDANLETILTQAFCRIASENGDMASEVSMGALMTFGQTVIGLPIEEGVVATGYTTWTMIDNSGYTIPAGSKIGMVNPDGDMIAFEVVDDYVLAEGLTSTPANDVFVRAIDIGTAGNALSGTAVLIDALNFVSEVTMPNPSSNGAEPEDSEAYLGRLILEMQTIRPGATIPRDFEILARNNPSVDRAVAVDLWNPADDTLNNERYVGLVVVDANGDDLSAPVKTEIKNYLDSLRETNFIVAMGSPTYTNIDVVATVEVFEGFDVDAALVKVGQALGDYLDPANWGRPSFGADSKAWLNADTVEYLEVASVINNIEDIKRIDTLAVNGGSVTVNLPGVVPLTRPGTIDVTEVP